MADEAILETMKSVTIDAGKVIMNYYQNGFSVDEKPDHTPVTQADRQAEALIVKTLEDHYPDIPIIAEERMAGGYNVPALGTRFFLVDPLDGTREFIKRNGEFTVNIALLEHGVPILGVIYQPIKHMLYWGNSVGAYRQNIIEALTSQPMVCDSDVSSVHAFISRSHCSARTHDWLKAHCCHGRIDAIGSSLKFCLLAEGAGNLYPRFEQCMEWDTAAGDAILRAAGGSVVGLDGKPLLYGKRHRVGKADFTQDCFIAFGGKSDFLKPEWLRP